MDNVSIDWTDEGLPRELMNYMRVPPDKMASELEGGGHASIIFPLPLEKKMLERNNLGKKEFTLTPSLNMICLVHAGTAAGAGHVACTAGVGGGGREMAAHAQLALFLFSWTPSPWRDTSHLYGVSTHLPRRHGQVCLQYLDKVSTPGVQVCFQKPPSLSRLPNLFLSSLN